MTTPALLAALRAVLPYATTEADNLRAMAADDASVADEADAATHAVTAARLALADAEPVRNVTDDLATVLAMLEDSGHGDEPYAAFIRAMFRRSYLA